MTYQAELVLDIKNTLGEGPHWDHNQKILYWVDILKKRLYQYQQSERKYIYHQFEQYIGSAVPSGSGTMIMAMQNGIYEYELETRKLTKITDPEEDKENNRFNDGKCDPAGRFWAGTMDLDAKKGSGTLYRLDRNGNIDPMVSQVSISNGLAWSPDKKYMYFIDTPTNQVAIYHYEDQTGDISFYKVGVKIPTEMGSPDGMTIDNEGMIWVALWGGAKVTRWNPFSGELLEEVHVPAINVTSCTFGGENLDELYITTANTDMSKGDLERYPNAGGLFMVKTNAKGMTANRYVSSISI